MTPTQKKRWRAALTAYCEKAERFRMNRGYSQRRRVLGYGLPADHVQIDDCSGFDSKVVKYANIATNLNASDPLGNHFNGIGNTESIQDQGFREAPEGKYLVGDIALWGPNDWDTHHTAICRKAGTRNTAIFTSHGHQSWAYKTDAPNPVTLQFFPQHLIGVYRLPELA